MLEAVILDCEIVVCLYDKHVSKILNM